MLKLHSHSLIDTGIMQTACGVAFSQEFFSLHFLPKQNLRFHHQDGYQLILTIC